MDRFVEGGVEIGAVQGRWIEIARGERQRSLQKWSLETGVVGSRAEADGIRVGLAFLHGMNELVAADPVIENAAPAAYHQAPVRHGRPRKPHARSEGLPRNTVLAWEVALMYPHAIRGSWIMIEEVLRHHVPHECCP